MYLRPGWGLVQLGVFFLRVGCGVVEWGFCFGVRGFLLLYVS